MDVQGSIDLLADWCQANRLTTIESKLRNVSGILDLSDLRQILPEDIEQIILDCQMNVGEKTRFRTAMKQLLPAPSPPQPSPGPVFCLLSLTSFLISAGCSCPASNIYPDLLICLSNTLGLDKSVIVLNQHTFKIMKELGKGGFGVVFEAIDVDTGDVVAIKQQTQDPLSPKNWFLDEIKNHKAISSDPSVPRVPKLITSSDVGTSQYLVMDFIPGEPSDVYYRHLKKNYFTSGPKAIMFLLQTLETLEAIHKKGILHRDLKPGNIMIHKYTLEPWIFDFGIAKDINLKNYSVPTDVGTLPFRPPEYLSVQPGPYTDIFALGATLLALTGLMTDDDITWDTVLNRCPYTNELKTVVSRMIVHDYLKRYQNCRDVVDDIKKTQQPDSPIHVITPAGSTNPPLSGTPKLGITKTVEIEKEVLHLEGHKSTVYGIVEIADGRIISLAYVDGTFKIWDTQTGKCTTTINGAGKGRCLALLSDGTITSGGANSSIQISDIKDGQIAKCLRELKGHEKTVNCIIECSYGTLATGSCDNTIKIWDMNTGECIITMEGHTSWVFCLTKGVDGTIWSGSYDNTIKLWSLSTGKCIKTLNGHTSGVIALTLIGQTGKLASGSSDETIKIWDTTTYQCIKTLEGHQNSVTSLVYLGDERLASGSVDDTIKIWNIENGQCIKTLQGHKDLVRCLLRLNDGRLVSGSDDQTIKIWG